MKTKRMFLHSYEDGDFNRRQFFNKPLKAKKHTYRTNVYLENIVDETKAKNELYRGRTFFSCRDGLLFGAYLELTKLGTIKKEEL